MKQDSFDEKILFNQANPSQLWKICSSITGKRTRPENHAMQDPQGRIIYRDQDKADVIASALE